MLTKESLREFKTKFVEMVDSGEFYSDITSSDVEELVNTCENLFMILEMKRAMIDSLRGRLAAQTGINLMLEKGL